MLDIDDVFSNLLDRLAEAHHALGRTERERQEYQAKYDRALLRIRELEKPAARVPE